MTKDFHLFSFHSTPFLLSFIQYFIWFRCKAPEKNPKTFFEKQLNLNCTVLRLILTPVCTLYFQHHINNVKRTRRFHFFFNWLQIQKTVELYLLYTLFCWDFFLFVVFKLFWTKQFLKIYNGICESHVFHSDKKLKCKVIVIE